MTRTPLEAERVGPYLALLFLMLSTATLFDGFDAAMLSFAAPDARATLDIGRDEWGYVNSVTRMGVMLSFFFLFFADRLGRRTMMLVTILGFTLFNGLTALVTDKVQFALCQLLARLFLTAEYSLAVIMVGEEFPARLRGRAVAILISLATVGVMVMAKLQPYVLLAEGAEGNLVHDAGAWLVAAGQSALGLERDASHWRALYALSIFPLVLILVLRLAMRETRRFEAARGAVPRPRPTLRGVVRDASVPWRAEYRARTAMVALLWNCVFLVTAPSVVYWVIFAREDLGLTPTQVGDIVFWGYGGGVAGHFVAGFLIDRIGRKPTCAGFYVLAAISIALLYQVPTLFGQYVFMIATVFCFAAANTSTHVYASELFPTEIRATGYGWTTNLVGRITEVVTPTAIGALSIWLGIPNSIAVVAIGPIAGAALVLRYAPETRGLTLEQIAETLRGGAPAPAPGPGAAAPAAEGSAPELSEAAAAPVPAQRTRA
jgi:putative MFS transporter